LTEGWEIKQIALPLKLDRQFSFDNYFGSQTELVIDSLRALVRGDGEIQIGLWGGGGSGKTHLLNACAHYARSRNVRFHFYDATQLTEFDASEFEGFEHCDVLAIDNLDAITGLAGWESRFYQVINRCRDGDFRFVYSLSQKPEMLETGLPDLRSRLQWGLMLHMPDSGEVEVGEILGKRARLLGIELSNDVIAYLLTHHSRNLASQMAILQTLDGASLSQRRRVTIPLIKQVLSE